MPAMDAKVRAKLKAWDRDERYQATTAMQNAVEAGDLDQAKELLRQFPLLDYWVPYQTDWWSCLAAAAGQLEMMNFWREREKTARSPSKQASLESLLFWATGYQYINAGGGNPLRVATHLLDQGANVEGDKKDYSPLHRAVFMNRPALLELLIARGANLSRPYATGESALQIAQRIQLNKACATLLEQAGAPANLPQKPQRPKPVRTIDLRASAAKLSAGIEKAVRSFARRHPKEPVTVIALASIPHEAYAMIAFDTAEFQVRPWDCTYSEFAWVKFPDWHKAFQGDAIRYIDLDGRVRQKKYDETEPLFKRMIVSVLKSLEQHRAFRGLNTAKGCKIGVEMTHAGEDKFWRLAKQSGK
jgi:hypothetical protein